MEGRETVQNNNEDIEKTAELKKSEMAKRLDSAGWGFFFIWVGIAFLGDFSMGIGLLGIGIIALGEQLFRQYLKLHIEVFWIVVGLLFTLGGIWELFEPKLPLVPVLFIISGIVLLVSIGRKKNTTDK
ncbi:MAG: hypothetical protein H8E46_00650 [FCB group bacterium]|nr:hypothetical protein [FCB group bacterium]